tara:strand:+ start:144 stop:482 length:339 start_codon:yes stop_codon:yes gene_type:complete
MMPRWVNGTAMIGAGAGGRKAGRLSRNSEGALMGSLTWLNPPEGGLELAVNRDDLPALVKAAAGADTVGLLGLAALVAALQLGQGQHAIGRNALASAAPGGSSFWYSHCSRT